jgi:3-deoxy-D-manno-octulosonate 8-phosphate phosphatase KdsC-like HAD superfamily phosphatase
VTLHRLKQTPNRDLQEVAATISARPSELDCSFNLGVADFYPTTSGKEKVAEYLMGKYGVKAEDACFLCDDDNDLPLARLVGKVFLPSIGHVSSRGQGREGEHSWRLGPPHC